MIELLVRNDLILSRAAEVAGMGMTKAGQNMYLSGNEVGV